MKGEKFVMKNSHKTELIAIRKNKLRMEKI